MTKIGLAILALFFSCGLFAQGNVTGKWISIDDATGKKESTIEIFIQNGKLYGKIIDLANKEDLNKTCTACKDERKGKKLVGMQIITALEKDDDVWEGDDGILDPKNGKLYDVKIWEENNKLYVRGYIGFVFRTQTWIRL